eukprot:10415982-Alexandrium_andersonii.AAC.1
MPVCRFAADTVARFVSLWRAAAAKTFEATMLMFFTKVSLVLFRLHEINRRLPAQTMSVRTHALDTRVA